MPVQAHVMRIASIAAMATLTFTSCTSTPSILNFDGSSMLETIRVYDPKANVERDIGVVLYVPAKQASKKPAVLLMSGCDGSIGRAAQVLVKRLTSEGILVAEVKSIQAFGNSCRGAVPLLGSARARHIDVARAMLVTKGVAADGNIALLGFSHGGWTIMESVLDRKRWAAAVAYYPYCRALDMPLGPSVTPTLILVGTADTWTPPAPCNEVVGRSPTNFTVATYAGATHAFDYQRETRTVETNNGPSVLSYDPEATADSIERSMAFLLEHLKR